MAIKLNTKETIVDYMKSKNMDSSYSARKKMAADLGITNYTGSETQNIQMLNTLKNSSATNTLNQGNGPVKVAEENAPVVDKADEGKKNNLLGVDDGTYDKAFNTPFEESQESKDLKGKRENALSNLELLTGKDQIISDSVMNSLNSSFVVPSEVKKADAYLSAQLEKIQSGKTSYSDQVKDMMDKIMGREKFSYDVDTDPLFQQALASAMNSGKQAMQDTIGQASALTGGYGSTYATTAGNQAYNAFIEDAYNNLPQYYQMALNAYQMEGEEMYRQFGALSELDDKEFNRNVTAYDATYQHRNQLWNEAYTLHRDSVNDAFAMADFELAEHGQQVSDAYNYYSASSDYADRLYEREYNQWIDEMDMILKNLEINNKEAWANKEFNEGVRQFEITTQKNEEHFTRELEHNSAENALSREHSSAENAIQRQHDSAENALQREHNSAENQKMLDFEATESAKNDVWNLLEQGIPPSLELLEKAGMPFDEETAKHVAETMKAYLEWAGYSTGGGSSGYVYLSEKPFRGGSTTTVSGGGTGISSGGGSYNNGSLTDAQVEKLQEELGVEVDGMWGDVSKEAAGGLSADEAWKNIFGSTPAESPTVDKSFVSTPAESPTVDKSFVSTPAESPTVESTIKNACKDLYATKGKDTVLEYLRELREAGAIDLALYSSLIAQYDK